MQEAETQCQLVELMGQDGASYLEDSKFVGSAEDAQISLDFLARSERVEEPGDGFLEKYVSRLS